MKHNFGSLIHWMAQKNLSKVHTIFTVNIGLIRDEKPVFGLVYLPASDDLYYGGEGVGAFFNGSPISTRPYNINDGLRIVGRKDHPHKDKLEKRRAFLKGHKVKDYVIRGSSLKFCMVADGQAHLYPRFVPTYEWDTAAAHAIFTGNRWRYHRF